MVTAALEGIRPTPSIPSAGRRLYRTSRVNYRNRLHCVACRLRKPPDIVRPFLPFWLLVHLPQLLAAAATQPTREIGAVHAARLSLRVKARSPASKKVISVHVCEPHRRPSCRLVPSVALQGSKGRLRRRLLWVLAQFTFEVRQPCLPLDCASINQPVRASKTSASNEPLRTFRFTCDCELFKYWLSGAFKDPWR